MAGGPPLPLLTSPGAPGDLRAGKQLIDNNGDVLNGTLPEVEQATPTISVSDGGLITASANQAGGIVLAGSKSATDQLATQAAKTVTPGTAQQVAVPAGVYTTGAITVQGDANLVPENIAEGVSIFGVTGTFAGRGNWTEYTDNIDGLYSRLWESAEHPKAIKLEIYDTGELISSFYVPQDAVYGYAPQQGFPNIYFSVKTATGQYQFLFAIGYAVTVDWLSILGYGDQLFMYYLGINDFDSTVIGAQRVFCGANGTKRMSGASTGGSFNWKLFVSDD